MAFPLNLNLAGSSSAASGVGGINLNPSVITGGNSPAMVNNKLWFLALGAAVALAVIFWARK